MSRPTLVELLKWAKKMELLIEIKGNGWTRVERQIGRLSRHYTCVAAESTLRKALLEAYKIIQKRSHAPERSKDAD